MASAHLSQVVRENIEMRGLERVPTEINFETEFLLDVLADQEPESFARDNGDLDEAGLSPQKAGTLYRRFETRRPPFPKRNPSLSGSEEMCSLKPIDSRRFTNLSYHVAADRVVASAVGSTSIRIIDGGDLTRFGFKNTVGDQSVVRVAIARHRVNPTVNTSIRQVRT